MAKFKYYPPEVRKRILQDLESEGNLAAICRRYGVSRNAVKQWRAKQQQGLLEDAGAPICAAEVERMAKEVGHLKELLGDKELEIAILKDMVITDEVTERDIADSLEGEGLCLSVTSSDAR